MMEIVVKSILDRIIGMTDNCHKSIKTTKAFTIRIGRRGGDIKRRLMPYFLPLL